MEFSESEFNEILETQVGNDPKSEHCKINSVITNRIEYNLNPDYQRGDVWKDEKRSELILSILQNICIPSIIVSKNADDDYQVIDGKQRLTTLFKFIDNEFPIIWNDTRIYYSETEDEDGFVLSKKQKKKLNQKSLVFCVYDNLDIKKQKSIFEKINYGEDLTLGEKLKGCNNKNVPIIVKLRDNYIGKIEDLSNCFKNTRDSQYLLISAICAILTDNEEYGSVGKPAFNWINHKDTDITRKYDTINKSFDYIFDLLLILQTKLMDYIKLRKGRSTKMIKKSDYLMFIYALHKNPECLKDLIQFSKYLFHVDKEVLNIYNKKNKQYIEYKTIGSHGTNNDFYETKSGMMFKILNEINKNNKTGDEFRARIFAKTFPSEGQFTCKICNKDQISLRNFQAAHIISKKNGGIMHLKNLIATCAHCNTSMGEKDIDVYLRENGKSSLCDLNITI